MLPRSQSAVLRSFCLTTADCPSGLITHFKVMVRPLEAINMLHQKMGEYLMAQG